MTNAQRKMLLLGLIPVLALVLGGAVGTVSTIRGKLDYNYATTYDKPLDAVTITANMVVAVAPSTDGKVHIALSGTYTSQQPTVAVRKPGSRELELGADCQGTGCRLTLAVELPSSTRVSVNASGTSVELRELTGDIQVTADNGSVNGTRLRSSSVSVSAESGSVDLGFDQAPANVEVTSSNGSIQVLVPRTTAYAIDAAADRGSTELLVNNDLSSPNRLHLRSTNGSITVDSH
jgi:putative adhesin